MNRKIHRRVAVMLFLFTGLMSRACFGGAWTNMAAGTDGAVIALAADTNNTVCAGGGFATAGGVEVNGIARWDGTCWTNLGSGFAVPPVWSLAVDDNHHVYAGGDNIIAKWDGTSWTNSYLSNGQVAALAVDGDNNLYAGGSFTNVGGVSAKGVAMWNGSSWNGLGEGVDQPDVRALAVDENNYLYAGGAFTNADGSSAKGVAMWDGWWWNSLGSGVSGGSVDALALDTNGNLYAGGSFTSAGGISAKGVAKWNGGSWTNLGSGVSGGSVAALVLDTNGNLYAGGSFTDAGGISANGVAMWNGSSWVSLGSGVSGGGVKTLASDGNGNLYAGGFFTNAGGGSAGYIAKWICSAPEEPPAATNEIVNEPPSEVGNDSARLWGDLVSFGEGGTSAVSICWGPSDGGTNVGAWTNRIDLGWRGIGEFSSNITGLASNTVYFFRCFASNSFGVSWAPASFRFQTLALGPGAHFVSLTGSHTPPFGSWAAAARDIQSAIDAAEPGDAVVVDNGIYSEGGKAVYGSLTNRIALDKPITVQSINGPQYTFIAGRGTEVGNTNGDGAVRCAYVTNGAFLAGFTLTNGHTRVSGDAIRECAGGGILFESTNAVASNCVIMGNSAYRSGGGARGGTLYHCSLIGNRVEGNGPPVPPLGGGGACYCTLWDCMVSSNTANVGGGVAAGAAFNSVITHNVARSRGGGAYSYLQNCVVCFNTSSNEGGGVMSTPVNNCIVLYNSASNGANYSLAGSTSLTYSCTTPLPPNCVGNITDDPWFVDAEAGDFHIPSDSPCVDKGSYDATWMQGAKDRDGNPRVVNGIPDMGVYEIPFSVTAREYLQGAYATNQNRMTTGLGSLIPLTAPYAADRRSVSAIPANVTDWVLVQLRETNGNTIVSRSAFLDRDGYVLADNGSRGIVVDVSPGTNCYLVMEHRNHLAVMSAQPLRFTNVLASYDFTTNWSCYYGGSDGCVQLKPGVWGMIAGDADGDGKITETDRKIVEQQKGRTGYLPGDLNLDGVVE